MGIDHTPSMFWRVGFTIAATGMAAFAFGFAILTRGQPIFTAWVVAHVVFLHVAVGNAIIAWGHWLAAPDDAGVEA